VSERKREREEREEEKESLREDGESPDLAFCATSMTSKKRKSIKNHIFIWFFHLFFLLLFLFIQMKTDEINGDT
jgi:hypothetical protein